jgi:hypothetical protein
MYNKDQLCAQIRTLYPDIGACGIDVDVEYDQAEKAWVVHLKHGQHALKTFLADGDAEACLEGKQCISLGLDIAQLRDNIKQV